MMAEATESTPIAGSSHQDKKPGLWTRLKQHMNGGELTAYSAYVAFVLCLVHLADNMDRLVLGVVTTPMAQDLHYGDLICMSSDSASYHYCVTMTDPDTCISETDNATALSRCSWNYNGGGYSYEVLVGPVYYAVFSVFAILFGIIADVTRRPILLGVAVMIFATMTAVTGLAQEYWQLLVLRLMIAATEATCTPLSTSLLGDYFSGRLLATAVGIYNWGMDIGYGAAFFIGNYAMAANIRGEGWRWAFYICGIPSILVGLLVLITIKEPERRYRRSDVDTAEKPAENAKACDNCMENLCVSLRSFFSCEVFTLCIATAVRKTATYSFMYNAEIYYGALGESDHTIGVYMAWIPIVGGFVGLVLGGYFTDLISRGSCPSLRILIIVISQLIVLPFAVMCLCTGTPMSYYMLLPYFMLGELWLGVSFAALVELIPARQRTTILGMFVFVVENVAGLGPVLVAALTNTFIDSDYSYMKALSSALLCTFPGGIALSVFFYILSYFLIKRKLKTSEASPDT